MKAKYFDPFTDSGFKRTFGQEASKPLRDLLNALLPPANYSGLALTGLKAG